MPITKQLEDLLFTAPQRPASPPLRAIHTIHALPTEATYHVGAYCRVSTGSEEQEGSLITQREHFLALIKKNPDWEFVDIYYEQGISGTKKETRPELNRLLRDCKAGRVNLVLTKSISRFARNTTDCLEMVRMLTGMGVHLVFDKEQIDTRLVESEFLMTILASLAEEESHSISENNHWAIQKRFQNNTYRPANAPFGYDLADGKLVINEEEAKVVRFIFDQYLAGVGAATIAKQVSENGVLSKRTGQVWQGQERTFRWTDSSILKLLQNISYTGDALLQQTFHDKTFKVCKNHGELPQYLITDRHPAIVARETFDKVQQLIALRRGEHGSGGQKLKHPLAGKVYCGYCGSIMTRSSRAKGAKNRYGWLCKTHHFEAEKCPLRDVLEENLMNCWQTMVNKLRFSDALLTCYCEGQAAEWRVAHLTEIRPLEERLEQISAEKAANQKAHATQSIEMKDFLQKRNQLGSDERIVKADLRRLQCPGCEETQRFQAALHDGTPSDQLLTGFVDKIICIDRHTYEFHLACGLILTEEAA